MHNKISSLKQACISSTDFKTISHLIIDRVTTDFKRSEVTRRPQPFPLPYRPYT